VTDLLLTPRLRDSMAGRLGVALLATMFAIAYFVISRVSLRWSTTSPRLP